MEFKRLATRSQQLVKNFQKQFEMTSSEYMNSDKEV